MRGGPKTLAAAAPASATVQGPVKKAAANADHGAITAIVAPAPGGAVAVTSAAATDLDTLYAAVVVLQGQVTTLRATVNSLQAKLRTAGVLSA